MKENCFTISEKFRLTRYKDFQVFLFTFIKMHYNQTNTF